jgi:hypothetical protein
MWCDGCYRYAGGRELTDIVYIIQTIALWHRIIAAGAPCDKQKATFFVFKPLKPVLGHKGNVP